MNSKQILKQSKLIDFYRY